MTKDVSGPPCPVLLCYTYRVGFIVSNDKPPSTLELKTGDWIQPLSATDRWACEKWCINTPVGENYGMLEWQLNHPKMDGYKLQVYWGNAHEWR